MADANLNGLTSGEAAQRFQHFGANRLKPALQRALVQVLSSVGVVLTAMLLPFTPLAPYLGFMPLPLSFFGLLTALLVAYLLMVEGGKQWFYKRLMKA